MPKTHPDYKKYEGVKPPPRKEREQWVSTSGRFDGTTTNKTDYQSNGTVPPRFFHKKAEYVDSGVKFGGISTQVQDYQPWELPKERAVRRAPAAAATLATEDR